VYPAGDEQFLLYEAAGLQVPPGGIPLAAGAVISNAGTLLGVADALEGKPVTHKYLTVAGCVDEPAILRVPIGISFAECIALAGGANSTAGADYFAIAGGPIMGRPVAAADLASEPVIKTTSGIIVLPVDHYLQRRQHISTRHMKNRARSVCIQCSICSDLCPRRLMGSPLRPHLVMRALAASADMEELLAVPAAQNAMLCCECGICEIYACPMELQPCRINIMIKQEMRGRGIKLPPREAGEPSLDRGSKSVPSRRIASRAGVLEYWERPFYEGAGRFIDAAECGRVTIPLRMHTGAPSTPCVKPGQRVAVGELVAEIPPGSLGARIHASIGGTVRSVTEGCIVIEAERETKSHE
jgi:Na+-translocating ferredoxin:NAD+ oxidoreductase RnfC subunit